MDGRGGEPENASHTGRRQVGARSSRGTRTHGQLSQVYRPNEGGSRAWDSQRPKGDEGKRGTRNPATGNINVSEIGVFRSRTKAQQQLVKRTALLEGNPPLAGTACSANHNVSLTLAPRTKLRRSRKKITFCLVN
jgi:hypothetical protein